MERSKPLNALMITLAVCLAVLSIQCGRKDVNRSGELRMRGEQPLDLRRKEPGDFLQKGIASWYGHPFHGRRTSSGEVYDMWKRTAAHKSLALGTWVRVVNHANGKETVVRINDRGPFVRGRVIDLSRRAAEDLNMIGTGTAEVSLYLMDESAMVAFPSVASNGFWCVQVGSFEEYRRARRVLGDLEDRGYVVRLLRADDAFRVRVGREKHEKQARKLAQQLARDGYPVWVLFEADQEESARE